MVELLHGKMIMMEKDAQVPPAAIALDIWIFLAQLEIWLGIAQVLQP